MSARPYYFINCVHGEKGFILIAEIWYSPVSLSEEENVVWNCNLTAKYFYSEMLTGKYFSYILYSVWPVMYEVQYNNITSILDILLIGHVLCVQISNWWGKGWPLVGCAFPTLAVLYGMNVGYILLVWSDYCVWYSLIARWMGPTWGPSGADRTQVGPMLAPWTLLSGLFLQLSIYIKYMYFRPRNFFTNNA